MTAITLRLGDRTVTARIDGSGQVLIDDGVFAVTPVQPGLYLVDDGQRRWQVAVADRGETRWVSIDGRVAVLEIEAAGGSRRRSAGGAGSMMAPMPATVVKVLAEAGQTVAEGDTVLVLEAMKMELPIRAPRAGTVTAIRCAQGELVQPGVALVEIE